MIDVKSVADATRQRLGRAEVLALAKSADTIHVARGKKVVTLDMKQAPPDDDTLAGYLLGPSGNLRAPTLRQGQTLYVGFSENAYRRLRA